MINILVPIVENPEDYANFLEKRKGKGYKIFVGIKNDLAANFKPKSKNIQIIKFSNRSKKEEIINSLHSCNLEPGKILVVRRVLTEEEFISIEKSEADVVSLKGKRNRFSSFFKKLLDKIVRKVFAFNYFKDISAICYGEKMFQLLSVCQNLSLASRIDKYVGVQVEEIETQNSPAKKDYCTWKNILMFTLATFLLIASIAGAVCLFVFISPKMLNIVLIVLALLLVLVVWFIALFSFLRTAAVGNLRYGRAEEV